MGLSCLCTDYVNNNLHRIKIHLKNGRTDTGYYIDSENIDFNHIINKANILSELPNIVALHDVETNRYFITERDIRKFINHIE